MSYPPNNNQGGNFGFFPVYDAPPPPIVSMPSGSYYLEQQMNIPSSYANQDVSSPMVPPVDLFCANPRPSFSEHDNVSASSLAIESRPTKRAVIIGINYRQTTSLSGSISDANSLSHTLKSKFGFASDSICLLSDEDDDVNSQPTRRNILNSIAWLVGGAKSGDILFFSFSGRGFTNESSNTNGGAGICPVDWDTSGNLSENELRKALVERVPSDCRLISMIDCQQSLVSLDLNYTYRWRNEELVCGTKEGGNVPAHCIVFCSKSPMTSGSFTGPAVFTFIQSIEDAHKKNIDLDYSLLCKNMSEKMQQYDFQQNFQLSSSFELDPKETFTI